MFFCFCWQLSCKINAIKFQEDFLAQECKKYIYKMWLTILTFLNLQSGISGWYTTLGNEQQSDSLYLYANKTYVSVTPSKENIYKTTNDCIVALVTSKNSFQAVAIQNLTSQVHCAFFPKKPSMVASNDSVMVVKEKNKCSNYCKTFRYKDLCGQCLCYDTCKNLTKRYVCDCRKGCRILYKSGFDKDGFYFIDPDGQGKISVFCEMKPKFSPNKEIICEPEPTTHFGGKGYHGVHTSISSFQQCFNYIMSQIKSGKWYIGLMFYVHNNGNTCYGYHKIKRSVYSATTSCEIKLKALHPGIKPNQNPSILIMARSGIENSEFWDRTMLDYEQGFGEFQNMWIGLERLHRITAAFDTILVVVMTSTGFKDVVTTRYTNVSIKSKQDGYQITFNKFDSFKARESNWNFGTNRFATARENSFTQCHGHSWWTDCEDNLLTPTATSAEKFGFGTKLKDISDIYFLLMTF